MCRGVRSDQLTEVLRTGASSLKEIAKACGAGTGGCSPCIEHLRSVVSDRASCDMPSLDASASEER